MQEASCSSSGGNVPTATYNVKGRKVFLTGGGRGLGRCIVDALLAKGAKVVFCDINEVTGKATEEEFQKKYGADVITFIPCDVRNDQQFKDVWQKTVEKLGHVDVCVNNAAIIHETNYEDTILVNLGGTIRGCKLAFEHMRTDKGGRGGVILNISSGGGIRHSVHVMPTYASTKHAIVAYTLSWANHPNTPARGVRWGTLCPGVFESAMRYLTPEQVTLTPDEWQDYFNRQSPQSPEEIAEAFMTLLEDGNSNGHALRVYKDKGEVIYHTMASNSHPNVELSSLVDVSRRVVPPRVPKP